jgi:NodT family efflux transporter outer membrane factor (OMF) lipoprotein
VKQAALALPLILAACSAPQPKSIAVQPVPALYLSPQPQALPAAEWWRRELRDPALARLITAALANSPDLAAAVARIAQARAGLRASEAERLPLLDGSAGVGWNRSSPNESGFDPGNIPGAPEIDRTRTSYRAGVDASWDADLFGRLRADTRAAQARLDAAGLDAAAVRLTLITDVARNLVAARAASAREEVARDTTASARESVGLAEKRVRGGLVAGIDVTRAETLLFETAALVPTIQAERSARIAALAALTGVAPAEIRALVDAAPDVPSFDSPAAGVPSDLLRRRPDVAAALARVAAADADTASALAARYPRLTITSAIGLVATALGGLFSGDALTASAGSGLAGPLLDFGRNRAHAEQAWGRADEAVAAYRQTVLRAFSEVETSLAQIDARQRQVTALERQLKAAQDSAGIARVQYRSGLVDYLGVLDAERSANRARDQIVAARAELSDAQLALFRAIGGDHPG